MEDPRRVSPAFARNAEPILTVLDRVLPPVGTVLEIASGPGEHAVFFSRNLASGRYDWRWQPTDIDLDNLTSIDAHARALEGREEVLLPAKHLDASAAVWPVERADAVVCINMIHIAPWAACAGLLRGAGRVLPKDGVLYLYGPFKRGGAHTAPTNEAFDASLRARDASWGIRDLDDVAALAAEHGFGLDDTVEMPANNLSVVFRKE
ncbi:DUF938 domain-containing protein [Hwanghaeella grinnelliae]|uniref:DUF938 domain-containing protein n=1 Tax=Hwanghaeella grinnelliae TaxID=2500179 RepID=A0A437QPJ9_9PROT|nr:DUF938 domain-containing protein [Hwanghaeella grinnelliae]RVU36442.1 DUF938 domain-containing protein [Hwanghaeella grinnelliae]